MTDWVEQEIELRLSRMVFPTLAGKTRSEYADILREEYRQADREEEIHQMRLRQFIRQQSGASSSGRMVVSEA